MGLLAPGAVRTGERPDLSVVICAYESREDLVRLLPSLAAQAGVTTEVVVVDNHSRDGLGAWLDAAYPAVRYLRAPQNKGYGWANNWGLRVAAGRHILVLNPDTELAPGMLRALVAASERHPDSLITPKLIGDDDRINACGLDIHFTGVTTCRGLGADPDAFRGEFPVPAVSGAAVIARREVWRTLGGFDERYFLYMEDVELSLRARLRGYTVWCAADVSVRHRYALHLSAEKFYWLERNRLLTIAKLYSPERTRAMRGALRVTRLMTGLYALRHGQRFVRAHREAGHYLRRHRDELRRERWKSEQTRQVPDHVIFRDMNVGLELGQLLTADPATRRLEEWSRWLYRRWAPKELHAASVTELAVSADDDNRAVSGSTRA